MNVRRNHCSDYELSDLLNDVDESRSSQEVVGHLETCSECQQKLTQLAGAESQWHELSEMLRPLEGDSSDSGLLLRHRSTQSRARERAAFDEARLKQFLSAPSHPEMLGRLGRYEVERVIGSGGMGVVFKGFDIELNRPVAIKLLAPHLARLGAARQRFAREARAAAAVVHEHVVAIHNVESEADAPFLVMQYVSGESLQVRVDREGPLQVNEILRIGSQVAAGLAAAHEQGIVHRDIKPANILLEQGIERAYLTDFGLARVVDDASLTQTGIVAGTPHYMSPEQASGEVSDQRSDLFSLGAVLYFMATGHPPFRAERAMGVLHRICHERHRPLWAVNSDVPDELSELVDQLLQKRAARRSASAEAVHLQLVEMLGRAQRPQRRFLRRLRRFGLRHRRRVLGGAACCAVLLATVGLFAYWNLPAPQKQSRQSTQQASTATNADVMSLVSPQESAAFANSLGDLGERLDRLEMSDEFASDVTGADDWWEELQSLQQRLDRLQGENGPEPLTFTTEDE